MDIGTTLLEYGADTNAVTRQGISPIHLAAQEGSADLLSLLLAKHANVNVCNKVPALVVDAHVTSPFLDHMTCCCARPRDKGCVVSVICRADSHRSIWQRRRTRSVWQKSFSTMVLMSTRRPR